MVGMLDSSVRVDQDQPIVKLIQNAPGEFGGDVAITASLVAEPVTAVGLLAGSEVHSDSPK
jgi:hypothetical protein